MDGCARWWVRAVSQLFYIAFRFICPVFFPLCACRLTAAAGWPADEVVGNLLLSSTSLVLFCVFYRRPRICSRCRRFNPIGFVTRSPFFFLAGARKVMPRLCGVWSEPQKCRAAKCVCSRVFSSMLIARFRPHTFVFSTAATLRQTNRIDFSTSSSRGMICHSCLVFHGCCVSSWSLY